MPARVEGELGEAVSSALAACGLVARSGFDFDVGEDAPAGPSGSPAKSALLIGNAGAAYWPHFTSWRNKQSHTPSNPLDDWSREVIGALARRIGARAVSPSDKPYLPFQQWAMRAEGLRPSPLGILIHPEYGLWHAYRGALLFDQAFSFGSLETVSHLCDACTRKPCLNSCPAGAYSTEGFDYAACRSHARGLDGTACRDGGCIARDACPHGVAFRYPADVQAFHMAAYLA